MHIEVSSTLKRDGFFLFGATSAVALILVAWIGPHLVPYDPQDMVFGPFGRPTLEHPLGTNDCGQDILAELVHGARNSLSFGFIVGMLGLILGVGLGVWAGWKGGLVDMTVMAFAEVTMAVPPFMLLILVAALLMPSPLVLAMVLTSLSWPTTAKAVRAQTLALRVQLHLRAASQMGGSTWYLIFRHLIPEMFPLYVVGLVGKSRMAIFMEASLAFLGLFEPGRKSLGSTIYYALRYYYVDTFWNWLAPAVVILSLAMMATSFLAISLEKVLDPRLRSPWA